MKENKLKRKFKKGRNYNHNWAKEKLEMIRYQFKIQHKLMYKRDKGYLRINLFKTTI